jgi:hypothetical protein
VRRQRAGPQPPDASPVLRSRDLIIGCAWAAPAPSPAAGLSRYAIDELATYPKPSGDVGDDTLFKPPASSALGEHLRAAGFDVVEIAILGQRSLAPSARNRPGFLPRHAVSQ